MKILQLIVLCLTTTVIGSAIPTKTEDVCITQKVCLEVVSQRWMTEYEMKRLSPFSLRSSAVRMRLSNKGDNEIAFLTGLDSVEPFGYRLFKKLGDTKWDYLPMTKQRSESQFMQSGLGASKYLRLKQNSVIEFEVPDWGNPSVQNEEHAFSIFIRLGGNDGSDIPIELVSDTFLPLKK